MFGLIKKDFLLMKSNSRTMIIVFIIYLMLAFQGTMDIFFIVPLIGITLFISTFSYDEFNNWNSYVVTLPDGRKNVVRAKYITSIILIIILGIVSLAVSVGIDYTKTNNVNLDAIISSLIGTIFSGIILISLFYPIVFKFGATNARIILFAMVFGIAAIIGVISSFVHMASVINMVNRLDNYLFMIIPIISTIVLGASYLISNKIYQHKEF